MSKTSLPILRADSVPDIAVDDSLQRIRAALVGSAEHPRVFAERALPPSLMKLATPEFFERLKPAAVLLAVMNFGEQPSLLLTRRSERLRQHSGQISFPGGRRDESDATLVLSALREAHEEVGLPPENVEILGFLDDYPTLTGYRITPVVGLVAKSFTPAPHADEVAEVFDLPLSIALSAESYQEHVEQRDGLEFKLMELHWNSYRIWGATAAILWDFRNKVMGRV
jgi:8-oxo-dGTP pyrophosphatase MutT (NUDIX family)